MKCKICSYDISNTTATLFDDRLGYPGEYNFYVCPLCGHGMLALNLTPSEISDMYTRYYPRGALDLAPDKAAKRIKPSEKFWAFNWVPKGSKVLEIGCGDRSSLLYLKNLGCDVYCVESDRNVSKVIEKYGLDIKIGLFDANDYAEDSFDCVVMEQVVEHIAEPVGILKGIERILRPNGALLLATPNMESFGAKIFKNAWLNWHTPYHVSFFSRKSLKMCLDKTGFELEKIFTRTNPIWYKWQFEHLFLRSRTAGRPSIHWSPYYVLKTQENGLAADICRVLANCLSKIRFFHVYGFFVDNIGLGDNFVIILRKPQ